MGDGPLALLIVFDTEMSPGGSRTMAIAILGLVIVLLLIPGLDMECRLFVSCSNTKVSVQFSLIPFRPILGLL